MHYKTNLTQYIFIGSFFQKVILLLSSRSLIKFQNDIRPNIICNVQFNNIVAETQFKSVIALQIIATSLCHTDATVTDSKFEGLAFPVIVGHEAAGIVESIGPGVTNFKPGILFYSDKMEMSQYFRDNS